MTKNASVSYWALAAALLGGCSGGDEVAVGNSGAATSGGGAGASGGKPTGAGSGGDVSSGGSGGVSSGGSGGLSGGASGGVSAGAAGSAGSGSDLKAVGGPTITVLEAGATADDAKLVVLVRGSDGLLYENRRSNRVWTTWTVVPGAKLTGDPDVAAEQASRYDVVGNGDCTSSGTVCQQWWVSATGWNAPYNLGTPAFLIFATAPAFTSPTIGRFWVFTRGSASQLYGYSYWNGGEWSQNKVIPSSPKLVSAPDAVSKSDVSGADTLVAGTTTGGRVAVVAHRRLNAGTESWGAWQTLPELLGGVTGGPALVRTVNGDDEPRYAVYARRSTDKRVWRIATTTVGRDGAEVQTMTWGAWEEATDEDFTSDDLDCATANYVRLEDELCVANSDGLVYLDTRAGNGAGTTRVALPALK